MVTKAPILQKFYIYDPCVSPGDEIGGLRVFADKDNDGALHVLTLPAAAQWWIDQGLAGRDPPSKLSSAHKALLAQITRGRSEDPDVSPVRVPRYDKAVQSGAPGFAASLASPAQRRKRLAQDRRRGKEDGKATAKTDSKTGSQETTQSSKPVSAAGSSAIANAPTSTSPTPPPVE